MEKWDLYDKNRVKSDIAVSRGEEIPTGLYRVVIHVAIINSEEKMLIQQRQPFKHSWPNMWDISVGGHVISGETSSQGAQREVKEELGIDISSEKIQLMKSNIFEKVIGDIYYVNMEFDLEKIVLQEEEVSDVMLASYGEIIDMIKNEEFFKSHGKVFMDIISDNDCKKMIKMV